MVLSDVFAAFYSVILSIFCFFCLTFFTVFYRFYCIHFLRCLFEVQYNTLFCVGYSLKFLGQVMQHNVTSSALVTRLSCRACVTYILTLFNAYVNIFLPQASKGNSRLKSTAMNNQKKTACNSLKNSKKLEKKAF